MSSHPDETPYEKGDESQSGLAPSPFFLLAAKIPQPLFRHLRVDCNNQACFFPDPLDYPALTLVAFLAVRIHFVSEAGSGLAFSLDRF